MKDDFIRKQYDHEVERQDKIVASLSLPVGILTALGTAAATMIWGFTYTLAIVTPIFQVLTAGVVFCFTVALMQLKKAYFGQTYEYLPRLFELQEYEKGLVAYYVGQGQTEEDAKKTAAAEFEEYLLRKMIKGGTKNAINNDEKSKGRYYANCWLFAVLTLTGFMVIPYAWDKNFGASKVPRVQVDNLDEILRERENGTNGTASTAAPRPVPATPEAGRAGEQGREGRGGSNGSGSADRRADEPQVMTPEQARPQPQQAPPPKPAPPDNTQVRKPGPGTVEKP